MADFGISSAVDWATTGARGLVGLARPVAALTKDIAPIAARIRPLLRWQPIASVAISATTTINNVRKDIADGNGEKATYEAITGVPEAAANMIPLAGPFVGALMRDGLRAETVYLAGENYAPEKSFLHKGWNSLRSTFGTKSAVPKKPPTPAAPQKKPDPAPQKPTGPNIC
jgi:hypothetical protein